MKVYSYSIIGFDNEKMYKEVVDYIAHYPYGERGFPNIGTESETIYSSKEKALDAAKQEVASGAEDYFYPFIMISEGELDNKESETKRTLYNLVNNKSYDFTWFHEYNHEENIYEEGDWVMFYQNQYFQIGRIAALAEGDEPYYLVTENNCLSDGYTHEHIPETWIVKKIEDKEAEKILPYKYFSNINIRYDYLQLKDSLNKKS